MEDEELNLDEIDDGDDNKNETNNDEGWVDQSKKLLARDLEELKRTTRLVKAALLKVQTSHKIAYLGI